ncbi:hypothetical protein I302_101371 [Kwoniella bestiolae CBS 10118]|uniref:Uncharacterized protein n=1 Tax=Kwoniella bestiolae CBS 10118 TaxID=1296100 RepID=A0A1B9GC20_9TREE|nr:hypothetical protein I302_00054 [Kwoniella bestiolae CBS 10118]OCF28566.1 hypothetical protein I302_00054 [Kwoniella bestiolae CBS 10118]
MDVSCSLEELSSAEREDQYKDILKGLIDLKPRLNEKSDRFLQNVLSYPKIQYYFLTIRDGLCTPLNLEMIVPYSLDKTSWEILEFASPYVLALDLEFEPHDHSSSQMARFDEINWEGMINLQELVLQIHRSSSSYPISSEPSTSQEYLHIYPSSPGKGLRHYTLSLIYDEPLRNLELQSIHEHEIKFVRSIARYFFNFFDPYNQPRVAVEVRSSGDEEFPSLMLDEFEQQLQVCLVDEVGRLIRENQKREEALVRFWA